MRSCTIITIAAFVFVLLTIDLPAQTVSDYDGNVYQTVTIGTQVWMRENLRALHYSDGAAINEVWSYNNKDSLAKIYGCFYSWKAAMRNAASSDFIPSGVQGTCPAGWHLPSNAEWSILINRYGGMGQAGAKLKESGTQHWKAPNTGATNESGFTALPCGLHYQPGGGFGVMGYTGVWWTSYVWDGYYYYVGMSNENSNAMQGGIYTGTGSNYWDCSVRCLKDGGTTSSVGTENPGLFSLYPNPAKNLITVISECTPGSKVSIYGAAGKLLWVQKLSQKENTIDISSLADGIYIISLSSSQGTWNKKLVKSGE